MNTPKSDSFVMSKYASRESLYADLMLSHRRLETQVNELREALTKFTDFDYSGSEEYLQVINYGREVLERTK